MSGLWRHWSPARWSEGPGQRVLPLHPRQTGVELVVGRLERGPGQAGRHGSAAPALRRPGHTCSTRTPATASASRLLRQNGIPGCGRRNHTALGSVSAPTTRLSSPARLSRPPECGRGRRCCGGNGWGSTGCGRSRIPAVRHWNAQPQSSADAPAQPAARPTLR
jgi:hypothetical protein